MNSKSLLFICVLATVSCTPSLKEKGWVPEVRTSLNTILKEEADRDNYAVFDFDKTSVVGDISQALWVYQIENLRFADAPSHAFLDGIPDPDKMLEGVGMTSAQMGAVLQDEYMEMKAVLGSGESIKNIRKSDTYLDFRARMYSFLVALDENFPQEVGYIWMPGLLTGYTHEEATQVVKDAVKEHIGKDKPGYENWISPDGRWGGPVERGLYFSPEMKELYKCLSKSGITPYVCSASHELVVEALACDPVLGPGLPPEQVFGLRSVTGERFTAEYDRTYPQPMKEGKVLCINEMIATRHGGKEPVIVGGDSGGDVPMLTAYPDTRGSLIIDVCRPAESAIGRLISKSREGDGRYLVQPNFITYPIPEGGGI